ncbi:MAG: MarR family winged helix-turn-helix transcriptional regulator [Steroidobacteraceae bacterium]
MSRGSRFAAIKPASIGVPSLLDAYPGLSQTELADLLGIQRVTAGVQVSQCIDEGLVRRQRSVDDKRRYELYITPKGRTYLAKVAQLIPVHEQHLFGHLTARERSSLYDLLVRLIDCR